MSACGHGGCGGLSQEFAQRVELAIVFDELVALLQVPPSREVFLEEHRQLSAMAGRRVPYRVVLQSIAERSAPL